ncbi:ABC transporter permease component [gut metagenome]|uniref:ABC transporter permease component n=1 Tax=gut metagenome TaxID=749906 RepID=J9G3W1_9ZZZZ
MLKCYIKQAWELLWQHKLYGILYLTGTAVPMVLTMIVIMYFHILTAPVYPENHRNDLYELRTVHTVMADGSTGGGCCNEALVRQWCYPVQAADAVTAIYFYDFSIHDYLQLPDGISEMKIRTKYTDPGFFRVFDFQFLAGAPFSQSDMEAGRRNVVIAASIARRLFGTDQAAGKTLSINGVDYTVAGVVRDASSLTPMSFAQVWLPYTCMANYSQCSMAQPNTGPYTVVFRTHDTAQVEALQAELQDCLRRHNLLQTDGSQLAFEGPLPVWKRNLQFGNQEVKLREIVTFWGALLLLFLIVPAVNLGGMISSKMELRRSEIGIYKAFGASRGFLLRQVIRENFFMTLMGGILGLLLSWVLLYCGNDWIIALFDTYGKLKAETQEILITPSMLFSPVLFLLAFLFCLVLNWISALLPAWRAMRVPIVQALGDKK